MTASQVQPHAPSTAELAAFRESHDPHAADECPHAGEGISDCPFDAPFAGGAWPHEREHGIGIVHILGMPPHVRANWTDADTTAHHGAHVMRRRAWYLAWMRAAYSPVLMPVSTFVPR